MTPLEERLRDELHDLAQRVAPGDLRPLRHPPSRNWTSRLRWLAPVAAATAVASVATGLVLARPTSSYQGHRPRGMLASISPAVDPPVVAISGGTIIFPTTRWIKVISPVTGQVVRMLSASGEMVSDAISPDGATIFVADRKSGHVKISQISVSTGRATFIADGSDPAISPDGRYLAYSPRGRPTSVTLRDLRTGSTRAINLSQAVDGRWEIAGLYWLGDGTQLVAIPSPDETPAGPLCASQVSPRGMCLVVVDIKAHTLSARQVHVPRRWSQHWTSLSTDLGSEHSIYIVRSEPIRRRAVVQVTFTKHGVVGRLATTMPQHAIPLSMAPGGDRVLFLSGTPFMSLWVGTVKDGRLVSKHVLIPDGGGFIFYSADW